MKEIIIGELNNHSQYLYWELEKESNARIGDYAIVEYMHGYVIAKIIGLATIGEEFKYDLKKVKCIVKKEILSTN